MIGPSPQVHGELVGAVTEGLGLVLGDDVTGGDVTGDGLTVGVGLVADDGDVVAGLGRGTCRCPGAC